MKNFRSILIANRGEIALRIACTARKLGYRVIAVYSDADEEAPHVRMADAAVRIGGPAPRDSYLRIQAILDAAKSTGAQAVHPGYGFLAENERFAQAVTDAGLIWIGPPAAAIRAMGDKAQAKRLMNAAGIPCVPGYDGDDQNLHTLKTEARRIGFPLMIKATAGGGGRGMRLVESEEAVEEHLNSARSEALAAFGDGTVLLERAVVEPRHVEVQVFADSQGNVVHLGERDCSVQRRHQKIIEEAPSPALTGSAGKQLRRRMGEMAVSAARAINYRGAGTIECLLDSQGNFYFMEMNTRLQVEHPVTEALTGYDLVEWQLRVAQGEVLPECSQEEILNRFESGGHAVEVRLCAEDPNRGFLPQSGGLLEWQPGNGIRVDHALEPGLQIPPYYDSMIAKFIAHGVDRDHALDRLGMGLREAIVLGIQTNQAFLAACLDHPTFRAGHATTAFIPKEAGSLLAAIPPMRPGLAALLVLVTQALRGGYDPIHGTLGLRWPRPVLLTVDGSAVRATVQNVSPGRYTVVSGGTTEEFSLKEATSTNLTVVGANGQEHVVFAADGNALFVSEKGRQTVVFDNILAGPSVASAATNGLIRAPMAGRIALLNGREGEAVAKGDLLLVLEAMKMEHPAIAPMDSVVARVCVEQGQQVANGAVLIELKMVPGPSLAS